ncbi:MAG: hypothetical protein V3S14_13510 [Anaerolineae bacterium]
MDEYVLEHITTDNDIQAALFIPFVVTRLQQATTSQKAMLTVQLKNIVEVDKSRELLVSWSTDGIVGEGIPLQEHVQLLQARRVRWFVEFAPPTVTAPVSSDLTLATT